LAIFGFFEGTGDGLQELRLSESGGLVEVSVDLSQLTGFSNESIFIANRSLGNRFFETKLLSRTLSVQEGFVESEY
jgi:hypothetical protein